MTEAEGKPPQGTLLSAEVEPFVPGQSNFAKAGGTCTGRPSPTNAQPGHTHGSGQVSAGHAHPGSFNPKTAMSASQQSITTPNGSSYTLTELPRYLTNCYPFVQDSITGSGPKPDVRWSSYLPHQHPPPSLSSALSYPSPSGDPYTSQQYPMQAHNMVMQYPQSFFSHPGGPPQPSQGLMPVSQGSYHTAQHYPGYYPNYPADGSQFQVGPYQGAGYGSYIQREPVQRPSRYSSSRDRQYLGGHSTRDRSSSSSSLESRRYTKTLVCADVGCQTDFPDEIANKTLAEKPSLLRRHKSKPRRRSQGNQTGQETSTSTDSETERGTVDSDSGYYSPKHGKTNHASVGMATHDTGTGPTAVKAQGYQQYTGAVVGTVPRHVTQQSGSPSAVYSMQNSMQAMMPQMVPTASNYAQPQHLHHPVPSRLQQQVPQQQQFLQQPPLRQPLQQPISYARILSQPPLPRHPVPVPNQALTLPPGPMHQQSPLGQLVENPRKNSGAAVPGNRTAQLKPGAKCIPVQQNGAADHSPAQNSKRKKKKDRKRAGQTRQGAEEQGIELAPQPQPPPPALMDMGDFPELPVSGESGGGAIQGSQPRSYSAILQQQKATPIREQTSPEDADLAAAVETSPADIIKPEDLLNPEAAASGIRDGKNARKRRKKAILAAQAAAKEYSEITEEQRQLQENLKKPSKKTKMPIDFDLGDMLAALEKQQQETKAKTQQQGMAGKGRPANMPLTTASKAQQHSEVKQPTAAAVAKAAGPKTAVAPLQQAVRDHREPVKGHNPLDASAPLKRGKERETPVKKKPSALKRVILKEREENKRLRTLQETCLSDAEDGLTQGDDKSLDTAGGDAGLGLSQDASERGSSMSPFMASQSDLSPLSQMSPMSMSPLSPGSPLSSGLSSPATGFKSASAAQANPTIHSRRFREYCNQVLDKDIDACCTTLLQTLVRFQDRQYHKDPTKAKAKRRIVMGLREVTKHLKLKKIKCIMVSPNLERIQSKGGLDDALNRIMTLSAEQNVPVVFALGRKALGRAVNKLVPVSVVGIFNYDGAEEFYKNLLDLTKNARESYNTMIRKYQQELEAAATAVPFSKHRHHLGHYRNLSGCSGISFSSVISEPISEDYPDPEPETDSRGNEIVREVRFDEAVTTAQYAASAPVASLTGQEFVEAGDSSNTGGYESDRGFSQEGAYSEDSGTVEPGTSKTSSETLEAAELDDVDDMEGDNEDMYNLSDVDEDEELDAIDMIGVDEDEEDEDDEDEDRGLSIKTDLPLDKGRIANWVAETQNTIQSLTLCDSDKNQGSTSLSEATLVSESSDHSASDKDPTSLPSPPSHCPHSLNTCERTNEEGCTKPKRTDCKSTAASNTGGKPSGLVDDQPSENHLGCLSQESS
ncbi:selenocysteine insertion sequence-binding protein 2-like [Acanthaster planci]|uniref:Selenocysteine insertion sequence-binding protein 2-like n=1 Tax=Acanthaster planci TaxID=133434 RepID=A0A8B7Z4G5_ACAPL|nr:selenocysteine insertion sequence-binding protein 2-like [Acanthaster planci]